MHMNAPRTCVGNSETAQETAPETAPVVDAVLREVTVCPVQIIKNDDVSYEIKPFVSNNDCVPLNIDGTYVL